MWAYTFAAWCLVAPVLAGMIVVRGPGLLDVRTVVLAAGSALLHSAYAATVQRAYRNAQLSQVYPLSRGLAPVLVAGAGWIVMGRQLREGRRTVALLAVLIPASYLTALYANQFIPISVVSALRSSSLIWAACAASMLLGERIGRVRACAITASAMALVAFAT